MRKILPIIMIIMFVTIFAYSQTGNYTSHNIFYLPKFGASGTNEYNEYNTYMEKADGLIWGNKTAIEALQSSLSNYVLTSTLNTTLEDYYTKLDIEGKGYLTSADISDFITDLTSFTTDDLTEGSNNKYFPGFTDLETDYDVDLTDYALASDLDNYISTTILPKPTEADKIIQTYKSGDTYKFKYINLPTPETGVDAFIDLTDTPVKYDDAKGLFLKVNNDENAIEFGTIIEADITDLGTYLTTETDPEFTSSPAYLIPAPTDAGKILETYKDGEDYKFKYISTPEGGGGGGTTDLSDLDDVVITTPADGEVLKYDDNSGKWINATDKDTIYTDNDAVSAIKADSDWKASDWDSAYDITSLIPTPETAGKILETYEDEEDENKVKFKYIDTPTGTDTTYTAGSGIDITSEVISLDFKYNPSLSNQTYSAFPDTGTVGEAVAFGDLLYFKWSDKKYYKAIGDDPDKAEVVAMAVAAISKDASGVIIRQGYVRNDSWDAFTDSIVYLSTSTAGKMQSSVPDTTGDQIKRVGQAVDSKIIFFNPSQDIGEVE